MFEEQIINETGEEEEEEEEEILEDQEDNGLRKTTLKYVMMAMA
jgi:hypothetical protein